MTQASCLMDRLTEHAYRFAVPAIILDASGARDSVQIVSILSPQIEACSLPVEALAGTGAMSFKLCYQPRREYHLHPRCKIQTPHPWVRYPLRFWDDRSYPRTSMPSLIRISRAISRLPLFRIGRSCRMVSRVALCPRIFCSPFARWPLRIAYPSNPRYPRRHGTDLSAAS